MKTSNKLTEGSILKSLLSLSIPIIFANILQTAYQLTDTFWVGRLGSVDVAAVSLSFPIIFFMISLGIGLTMAGTILVAQYKGKKDQKSVYHVTSQTLFMVIAISLVLSILGYLLSPILINFMGAKQEVFDSAVSYIKISFIGMVFMFSFMAYQSLMRGAGLVKIPTLIVLGTVILNLVLDPLFIFGFGNIPGYGVKGAAIATIFTQVIAAFIGISLLIKGKKAVHLNCRDIKPDFALIKRLFQIGLPTSIEHSMRSLGILMMTFLVTSFGTITIAAYGIGTRIFSFVIIPALGLSIATATLVGQNIGANQIRRAEKIAHLSAILGFIILTIVGIITFFLHKEIALFFIPNEIETAQKSALFIKIISLTFGLLGIEIALSGAFKGSGNTITSMFISIISLWFLRFPIAYVLSKHTSLSDTGIWAAFAIANIISAIVAIAWFSRGEWKHKKIT